MSSVSAAADESGRTTRPSWRSIVTPAVLRLMEVGAVLIALYVAWTGVQMLEDRESTTRAVVRILLAAMLMAAGTWRVRNGTLDDDRSDPLAVDRAALTKPRELASEAARSWQAVAFMAILLGAAALAVFFRFNRITTDPYGIWFDEAQNGIVAKSILEGERPIFIGGLTQLPALFFYVFAAAMAIMGDTVTALRTVTGIAGIITVVFVYLLGRELFDHRTGVIAAFFMAVMRWHVNFSRFGMHGVFAPLFMAATFYFVARGLNRKGTWNFAVAGVLAGIGLQGYYGFLLAPFVGLLWVIHYVIFERKLAWRELATGVLTLAVFATIVYAPLGIWAYRHPDQFNQRQETVTITKDRSTSEVIDVAWDSTKKHLLMFNQAGDRNGRHNIPGAPMLDAAMGALFVLGAGYALLRINRTPYFLLLAWIAVCLQSGIWSVDFEAPQAYRTIGVTPAVAMLAALPLALLWRVAADPRPLEADGDARFTAPSRGLSVALAAVAIVVTAGFLIAIGRTNYDRYFNDQLLRFDAWTAYDTDATYVAKEMQELGVRNYQFRTATVLHRRPVVLFLNPEHDEAGTSKPFDWTTDLPADTNMDTVYLFDLNKEPFFEWLQRLYPEGTFEVKHAPLNDPRPVAFKAIIPAEAVREMQGVDATYTPASGTAVTTEEESLTLDWSADQPAPLPLDAGWSAWIRIPVYGEHMITLLVPGIARIFLDGELVAEGTDTIEFTRELYKGHHELRVEARIERAGRIDFLLNGGQLEPWAFFNDPAAGRGLLATFHAGTEFEGEPVLQQLDPMVGFRYHAELTGVAIPFSARWTGFIEVPADGVYGFEVDGNDTVGLRIDGERLSFTPGERTEVALTAGRHPIEVTLQNTQGYAGAFVYWWTPGATEREIIPPEVLSPR